MDLSSSDGAESACAAATAGKLVPSKPARASFQALDGLNPVNDDQRRGIDIVGKALQAPLRQIAENAGHDGA
jgi:chaperonin GroEL